MNRGLIEATSAPIFSMLAVFSLPRFMNRGLIEAMMSVNLMDWTPELPRFMNRGLIEAQKE